MNIRSLYYIFLCLTTSSKTFDIWVRLKWKTVRGMSFSFVLCCGTWRKKSLESWKPSLGSQSRCTTSNNCYINNGMKHWRNNFLIFSYGLILPSAACNETRDGKHAVTGFITEGQFVHVQSEMRFFSDSCCSIFFLSLLFLQWIFKEGLPKIKNCPIAGENVNAVSPLTSLYLQVTQIYMLFQDFTILGIKIKQSLSALLHWWIAKTA